MTLTFTQPLQKALRNAHAMSHMGYPSVTAERYVLSCNYRMIYLFFVTPEEAG